MVSKDSVNNIIKNSNEFINILGKDSKMKQNDLKNNKNKVKARVLEVFADNTNYLLTFANNKLLIQYKDDNSARIVIDFKRTDNKKLTEQIHYIKDNDKSFISTTCENINTMINMKRLFIMEQHKNSYVNNLVFKKMEHINGIATEIYSGTFEGLPISIGFSDDLSRDILMKSNYRDIVDFIATTDFSDLGLNATFISLIKSAILKSLDLGFINYIEFGTELYSVRSTYEMDVEEDYFNIPSEYKRESLSSILGF
jgi:hypothetical protein